MHRVFALPSTLIAAAVAALALASSAQAQTVTIQPIAIAPALQEDFDKTYGAREAEYLKTDLLDRLSKELAQEGLSLSQSGGDLTMSITLEAAKPNRPTFQQLIDKPGLDFARSFGVGGASIRGEVRLADGTMLREVRYRWYDTDIAFSDTKSTWSDAQRVIRRFADETAKAAASARPAS